MKTKTIFKTILLSVFTLFIFSCDAVDQINSMVDTLTSLNRVVKYEITGNVTGKIDITYTDATGNLLSETISSLPWSKTITYPTSIKTAEFSGGSSKQFPGVKDQTATLKIYGNGIEKISTTKTIDDTNLLKFDKQSYDFK